MGPELSQEVHTFAWHPAPACKREPAGQSPGDATLSEMEFAEIVVESWFLEPSFFNPQLLVLSLVSSEGVDFLNCEMAFSHLDGEEPLL